MQDYKSLCAAVTICSTLVNIQTHIRRIFTSLFGKFGQLSSNKLVLHIDPCDLIDHLLFILIISYYCCCCSYHHSVSLQTLTKWLNLTVDDGQSSISSVDTSSQLPCVVSLSQIVTDTAKPTTAVNSATASLPKDSRDRKPLCATLCSQNTTTSDRSLSVVTSFTASVTMPTSSLSLVCTTDTIKRNHTKDSRDRKPLCATLCSENTTTSDRSLSVVTSYTASVTMPTSSLSLVCTTDTISTTSSLVSASNNVSLFYAKPLLFPLFVCIIIITIILYK